MFTREVIARVMQLSALALFFLAMGLGPKMVTVQGPAHAPAKQSLGQSLADLQASVDAVAALPDMHMKQDMSDENAEDTEGMAAPSTDDAAEGAGMAGMKDAMAARHDLVSATAAAVLANAERDKNEGERRSTRGAHAHGNLESLWVFAASLLLIRLSVPIWLTAGAGGALILGSWLHSGIFVGMQYGVPGLLPLLKTGAGPFLLMLGVGLLGLSVLLHWWRNGAGEA